VLVAEVVNTDCEGKAGCCCTVGHNECFCNPGDALWNSCPLLSSEKCYQRDNGSVEVRSSLFPRGIKFG
jgi:hypothetical protein